MEQAEANRVDLYVSKETNWGETPSTPTMAQLPYKSETLRHGKQTVTSDTIRADRMRDAVAEVGANAEGDLTFELKFTDFLTLIEGALASAFTAVTVTGSGGSGDLQFTSNDIVGPSGAWNNLVVGQYVRISGSAAGANDGIRKVTAKTATNLTCDGAAFTAQNNSTATVAGKVIRNGTTKTSFLLEKRFLDIGKYVYFTGMRVAQMNLELQAKQILTGSFSFMGKEGVPGNATVAGSSTPASTDDVMNATGNVGTVLEGGVALTTAIKSVKLGLNNNLRALDAVASRTAIGVNLGTIDITGTLEAYFEDLALYTKFIQHTASSFSFRVTDPAGNVLIVTLPKIYFTNGNPQAPGINQDIMLPLEFTAIRDATLGCEIQIDALAA